MDLSDLRALLINRWSQDSDKALLLARNKDIPHRASTIARHARVQVLSQWGSNNHGHVSIEDHRPQICDPASRGDIV